MLGLEFASDRPTETKSLHCPSGFITGIRVRYGRRAYAPLASSMPCPAPMQAPDGRLPHRSACAPLHRTRSEDRDLYDFKLKCGNRWTSWSGLWFKSEVEDKEWECPSKMYVTGMEVTQRGLLTLTLPLTLTPTLTLLTPTATATLTLSRSSGAGARSATATRTTLSCSAPVTPGP